MQIMQSKRYSKDENRKSRFQSFQNLKENKFSAYKYEPNNFIGKNNYNNVTDEEDYFDSIQERQQYLNGQEMIKVNKEKQQQEGVDNLCQLWDKLGQQQQHIVNETSDMNINSNTNRNQLTEEELLKCFGDQQQESELNRPKNKVIINLAENKILVANQKADNIFLENKNHEPLPQSTLQEEDQDLMEIWGQDQQAEQLTQGFNTPQSLSQKQPTNNVKDELSQQKQQHYDWMGEQSDNHPSHQSRTALKNSVPLLNKLQNPTTEYNNNSEIDQKMELQDPNLIVFQCNNKADNQRKNNKKAQTVNQNQVKNINTSNSNSQIILPQSQSKHANTNNKPPNLSIIKQILLQNNAKGMVKLIPNRHYQIFDIKTFALNPFKTNTYSYFGVQAKNHSLICQPQPKLNSTDSKDHIFYLYQFETQQALLQLKPQPLDKSYFEFLSVKKTVSVGPDEKIIKRIMQYRTDLCYKVRICSTKQHIATLFYKAIKDGYLYDLRLFDQYENIHSEPIALIQVKDGYVNDCCYCDTNVFFEKGYLTNPYSAFQGQKTKWQIEKLKMILNLKNGKLTANMGIGGIQSSPFNCCLQHQDNLKFIYLLGLLFENVSDQPHVDNKNQQINNGNERSGNKSSLQKSNSLNRKKNNFIIKIGQGVTPLLGLAIAAGRKMYIDSFQ